MYVCELLKYGAADPKQQQNEQDNTYGVLSNMHNIYLSVCS